MQSSRLEKEKQLDETFVRAAHWLLGIVQRKNDAERNTLALDRRRLKESTFISFAAAVAAAASAAAVGSAAGVSSSATTTTTPKDLARFFEELSRGKELLVRSLLKRFPNFKRRDECMEQLYAWRVPLQRALWYFRMAQVAHASTPPASNSKQQKRPIVEQYSSGNNDGEMSFAINCPENANSTVNFYRNHLEVFMLNCYDIL